MEPLNADLTLGIIARSDDAATVVRCAAPSAILDDPSFRRRLELRAAGGLLYVPPPASSSSLRCSPCPCAGEGDRYKTVRPFSGVFLKIFGSRDPI
uniref:Uncharacterized protein n=1 Tax=Setaria italica TaxID=4555 RepID=K4ANY7_SETIT